MSWPRQKKYFFRKIVTRVSLIIFFLFEKIVMRVSFNTFFFKFFVVVSLVSPSWVEGLLILGTV